MVAPLDDTTRSAIERVAALVSPHLIYIFGSRAHSDHEPDSDLDLLIVLPDPVGNRRQRQSALRDALVGHRPVVDPWIMGWLEFEETKNVVGGLAYPATHDGYVVHSSLRSPGQATWDFVQRWLGRATEDLAVALELMERERTSYDAVGLHAQQAAEDFLKALLIRYQVPFPKTGNIRRLIELAEIAVPGTREHLDNVHSFSVHGGEIRDPESQLPLNRDAGARAVEMAAQAQAVVKERLTDYLRAGRPTAEL